MTIDIDSESYRRGRLDQLIAIRDLLKGAKKSSLTHTQTIEIFEKSLDDLIDTMS
jgi:hypothetical protein